MKIYGIRNTKTTKGHPRANGKVERFMRTLKVHLGMMVNAAQDNWPKCCPLIGQAYRSTPGVYKYSPFEILFGMSMRTPLDLQRGAPPNTIPDSDPETYPGKLRKILDTIHHEIREQMKHSTEYMKMKKRYDQSLNITPFNAGDSVWYYSRERKKGKTEKLLPPCHGPYIIMGVINECVARIQEPTTGKIMIVHMDKLAAYRPAKSPLKAAWLTIL